MHIRAWRIQFEPIPPKWLASKPNTLRSLLWIKIDSSTTTLWIDSLYIPTQWRAISMQTDNAGMNGLCNGMDEIAYNIFVIGMAYWLVVVRVGGVSRLFNPLRYSLRRVRCMAKWMHHILCHCSFSSMFAVRIHTHTHTRNSCKNILIKHNPKRFYYLFVYILCNFFSRRRFFFILFATRTQSVLRGVSIVLFGLFTINNAAAASKSFKSDSYRTRANDSRNIVVILVVPMPQSTVKNAPSECCPTALTHHPSHIIHLSGAFVVFMYRAALCCLHFCEKFTNNIRTKQAKYVSNRMKRTPTI